MPFIPVIYPYFKYHDVFAGKRPLYNSRPHDVTELANVLLDQETLIIGVKQSGNEQFRHFQTNRTRL